MDERKDEVVVKVEEFKLNKEEFLEAWALESLADALDAFVDLVDFEVVDFVVDVGERMVCKEDDIIEVDGGGGGSFEEVVVGNDELNGREFTPFCVEEEGCKVGIKAEEAIVVADTLGLKPMVKGDITVVEAEGGGSVCVPDKGTVENEEEVYMSEGLPSFRKGEVVVFELEGRCCCKRGEGEEVADAADEVEEKDGAADVGMKEEAVVGVVAVVAVVVAAAAVVAVVVVVAAVVVDVAAAAVVVDVEVAAAVVETWVVMNLWMEGFEVEEVEAVLEVAEVLEGFNVGFGSLKVRAVVAAAAVVVVVVVVEVEEKKAAASCNEPVEDVEVKKAAVEM
ncbi:hypothetical protein HMI56_006270 [Coelomomyces lativittatus]|nr:hypothetical protein HMI56_006270 [Coelomomyces lativittatus]